MKILRPIIFISILILTFFTPNPISAQGIFNCGWNGAANQCSVQNSNCDTGYIVGSAPCYGLAVDVCETGNPHTCVVDPATPLNTYSCAWRSSPGVCGSVSNCGSGYMPGTECGVHSTAAACQASGNFPCIVNPVNPPNTFQCNWNSSTGRCMVQTSNCDSGFTWDNNVCLVLSVGQCTTASPQPCIVGGSPPPVTTDNIQIFCDPFSSTSGIRTAIGCINASDTKALIGQVLGLTVRVGSGILFLCIIYAGYLFTTAAGSEDQITQAKQLLSSSLIGYIAIALSILIFNFIGVRVLNLTTFGFNL